MTKKIRLKISQRISEHLIEAVLIFTSVFFAFWLTEYRKSRNDEATLEVSLKHIASELRYNHERVEFIYEYHTNLLTQIDSLEKQSDTNWKQLDGSDLKNWKGIQTPTLRSTAYQTFLNSNTIDNVEFNLAESLTSVYYAQSIIEHIDKSLIQSAITDVEGLMNLPRLRNMTRIYLSTLPDVMIEYQKAKKNWLDKYGYDIDIKKEGLKKEINRRLNLN